MTDTIPRRLFDQARIRPDAFAYFEKRGGVWRGTTWKTYASEVRRAARALVALGFQPGQRVCILGNNRPEWAIFDLAAMVAGGAPAGIYTTCSKEEVAYIVHHAEAPVVLVENRDQWEKIQKARGELPHLRHVVTMRDAGELDDPMVLSWDAFLAKADATEEQEIDRRLDALEPAGLATLIYTSGTTGPPKGVMLSHENLAWTARTAQELTGGNARDVALSYLPLSHIAEQMFTLHGPCTLGSCVYYAESILKVADNLKEVRPTIFFGVPRIWEKLHAGISGKLALATGAKAKIARFARGVGARVASYRTRGEPLPLALALQYELANRLVFSKLREALGLDRARVMVSGAAPIAEDVLEVFASLDLIVLEVYGQSEDTGPTSFNRAGMTRFGSVGPAIPGVDVKIAEDGEILVRGPNVFLGYFKDPEATAEALQGGYLCSGDLGEFDRDGFLFITGRKKDILITAGGKNIAPKNIEGALKNHALVGEAVVIGDRRKYLTALVSLDPEAAAAFAKERGLDAARLHEDPAVRADVQRAVDEINATLARVETVKRFTITKRPFSIEAGELTPTLKVKRKVVNQNFAAEIEAMYADDAS